MGKRIIVVPTEQKHTTPTGRIIRKRKRNSAASGATNEAALTATKSLRANHNHNYWHENDDEDSSSNDAATITPPARNQSSKHANNSSIILSANNSINESPKPVYTLLPSVVNGTILYDLMQKPWRLGKPIGKGNFGEIFLASDNITIPVTNENAKYVVKIEPHSNGPLFVEIHCLMNTAKKHIVENNVGEGEQKQRQNDITTALPQTPPSGIPNYIASGSHCFGDARYRFLVLQRFDRDLHSLIKNCRVHQKSVLTLAVQIVNVLECLHDKGYCHNDVKAQNLMISKCKYYKKQTATAPVTTNGKSRSAVTNTKTNLKLSKYDEHYEEKQQTTDSGNSSEQEANDDDVDDTDFVVKRQMYADDELEDEDFDDGATSNSNNSNNVEEIYETPVNRNRKKRPRNTVIEYSGSNPVRSCRRQKRNSIYEEMVKSHYLRPTKRISYSEFFNEDGISMKGDETTGFKSVSSDDDSEEFIPHSVRRSVSNKKTNINTNTFSNTSVSAAKRLTRRQEKLLNGYSSSSKKHLCLQQERCNDSNNGNISTTAFAESLTAAEEERIFLIDFGLASKFMDNGVHRPFVMDQRRAHDGTLEFTSRDAHMGAHSRRSDLECLGYNLIFWSQGYLPWKDAAIQHQQEKVHRAKEYLMTDVREMLKQIYGKQVPKYLGEFLHQVGQLAYHARPDYARYRRIFEKEFQQLGYSISNMRLDSTEIVRTCVRVKEEIENKNDIFEMNKQNGNGWSIMKNLSVVGTPFHERTLSNRVSPKNLRSKSDKKSLKKKKFSWAEILSQDPDQIARERAEKEFDREEELSDVQQPTVRRYEGKPTYAILEILQRLRLSGRLIEDKLDKEQDDMEMEYDDSDEQEDDEDEDVGEGEGEGDGDADGDHNGEEDVDDDYEIESDASDASEPTQHHECNMRTHNTRSTTVRKKDSPKCTRIEENQNRTKTGGKRSTGGLKCAIKAVTVTRSKNGITAINKSSNKKSVKKSNSNRNNRKGASNSETSETQHNTTRHLHNLNNVGSGHQVMNGGCGNGGKVPERRRRRCLIKTDTELDEMLEPESNSNYSPDVCSLFNVWKKINNESIYYRGSTAVTAAANRHCKK